MLWTDYRQVEFLMWITERGSLSPEEVATTALYPSTECPHAIRCRKLFVPL